MFREFARSNPAYFKKENMNAAVNEITINGVTYVPKGSEGESLAKNTDGLDYVIIRAKEAGVFAGFLGEDKDTTVILKNCRRLWYWSGAASCSDLARKGVSDPKNCKFCAPIAEIKIMNVIEQIKATDSAKKSIEGVAIWEA